MLQEHGILLAKIKGRIP